jgi:hypothetical protein
MGVAGNAPTAVAVIANRANTQVCPYIAPHRLTICPATPQMGDRKGRPCIVWRLCHWGAGAIVGATFTVALMLGFTTAISVYPCRGRPACLPFCGNVCPCATMFALQRNAAYCVCRCEWAWRQRTYGGGGHRKQGKHTGLPLHCPPPPHNMPRHAAQGRPQGSPLHCVAAPSLVCNGTIVGATFTVALVQRCLPLCNDVCPCATMSALVQRCLPLCNDVCPCATMFALVQRWFALFAMMFCPCIAPQ